MRERAASAFLVSGALLIVCGHVIALANGQFRRWAEGVAEDFGQEWREVYHEGNPDGAGPGVSILGGLMCFCAAPLVGPAVLAAGCLRCLRSPSLAGPWRWAGAVWAAAGVIFSLFLAADCWGPFRWEWPGFFIEPIGGCLSAIGHALAVSVLIRGHADGSR